MKVEQVATKAITITDVDGLDRIHAFWMDVGLGQGYVTIICYGSAWTTYFGGMNGLTIRQFFADAGTDYLVVKLGITPYLKQTKSHEAYLTKIINAVKAALRSTSEQVAA